MTGQAGSDFSSHWAIEEIEITHHIQNLMPDKFVRESEFGIDDLLIVNQDEVVKPPSPSHSHLFEHLYIFEKTKCSRRSDLIPKGLLAL